MGDDLKTTVEALAKAVQTLQATAEANAKAIQTLSADRSSSSSTRQPSGEHHNDRPPRFQKMDFPRYDGKSDPLIFINRCESYFHQQRIMEEEKVWMASYNLEEGAQLWFIQVQEDEGVPTWRRFKDLLNLRYGPPLRSAPLFELADCRRTGTVEEYQDRFQALLPRAGPLAETQRVQLFTGGLLPPLSHAVRIHNPQSLAAAMSLARQVELMELDKPAPAPARPAARGLLPAPAPRLALPAPPTGGPPIKGEGNPVKRLSQEEQAERRRLGLCYNCNEKYSRGHNRVCRRLFYINGVELTDPAADASDIDPDAEAPVFSLQAVAGVPICDTMQVSVSLGDTTLVALLDTGSTHNFIGEDAARRTGLPIQPRPRLTATIANGERITCPGVLRQAPIFIDGNEFHVDLFVMPLAGYDLVLGTQWMVTLGPIVWNFQTRTMSFRRHGREVCWSDVAAVRAPLLSATAATASLLDGVLAVFDNVFAEPQGLPPKRVRDHSIVLKPGAPPVAVRPYRYPAAHKDELERQCATMIKQGIVRRSDSAFSSPVIRPSVPMSQGRRGWLQSPRTWRLVRPSWGTCVTAWSRHRRPRSSTMTGNIVTSSMWWAIGFSFDSDSAPCPPYPGRPRGS